MRDLFPGQIHSSYAHNFSSHSPHSAFALSTAGSFFADSMAANKKDVFTVDHHMAALKNQCGVLMVVLALDVFRFLFNNNIQEATFLNFIMNSNQYHFFFLKKVLFLAWSCKVL